MDSRFSNTQHQGSISLNPDSLINISEFESGCRLEDIEILDEKQTIIRELGDLYTTFIELIPKNMLVLEGKPFFNNLTICNIY